MGKRAMPEEIIAKLCDLEVQDGMPLVDFAENVLADALSALRLR